MKLCVCARNARWSNRSGSCDLDVVGGDHCRGGILAVCTGMSRILFGLSEDLELI